MVSVKVYAQAPATKDAQAQAIADYRGNARQSLATGVSVNRLPTSTDGWIKHLDTFTLACKHNNEVALENRGLVGTLEQDCGEHWRFGFELIRAGMEAAMNHQQARVRDSNQAEPEVVAYQHLLTSYQVAMTTFHAFGNPSLRGPSIH